MHRSIKSCCTHCLAPANAPQQGCKGGGGFPRHRENPADPAHTGALRAALGPGAASWRSPGQSSALGAGLAASWPSTGTGYGWAPTPAQADSSGAHKYPPVAPGATSKLHTTHSVWDGFLVSPRQQSGAVFPCFNVGETKFFDTQFYSDPTRGGVFSQKTLLQPPLALQFSLSAGDTIFLNQN